MKMILASASPRRRELLQLVTTTFSVQASTLPEVLPEGVSPLEAVVHLAVCKAQDIAAQHPDCVVIGADTVVVLDGQILGKPVDLADATHMLEALSGREHLVLTGVAVVTADKLLTFVQQSAVTFYPLNSAEIAAYVATDEPYDKAGAYGIQGHGALFVEQIQGDYFNIMGLPVARLFRLLKEQKLL